MLIKIVRESRYAFPSSDYVHRCSLNGGVQVVKVAEYICKSARNDRDITNFSFSKYPTMPLPIGGGTGVPHGARPPLLFLGGLAPTFFPKYRNFK